MSLSVLSFTSEKSYTRLDAIARERGHAVDEVLFEERHHLAAWAAGEDAIERADALYLPHSIPLRGGKPEWRALLHRRIAEGCG